MLVGACGGVALPLLAQRLRRSRPGTGGEGSTEFASREAYFRWRAHSPRVWFAQGGGGNTLLYQGSRGALAVDAKSFGLGRTLAREGLLFGVSVTHLAMTHHHVDHCGGSEAFGNAVRLAHRNAEPRILATAAASLEGGAAALSALEGRLVDSGVSGSVVSEVRELSDGLQELTPRDFGPTRTFDVEEVIDLGDAPVLVRWVSPGHTDGDLYVHLPDENVLHCGDLLFHGRHPYVDVGAGATPRGWARCIEAMLEHCDADTVIVPGHGDATDRAGLAAQLDYFRRLEDIVEEGRRDGRSREEVQTMGSGEFQDLDWGVEQLSRNLGIVYDEVAGTPPGDR